MFSHSVNCLFILLMVSFAVQKLFSLMWSHLFIFSFISLSIILPGLFILLMVSFAVKKVFSLMKAHFFIFAVVSLVQGDSSKKILRLMLNSLSHMFLSRTLWFQVLHWSI